MLPDSVLSTVPVPGHFLAPRNIPKAPMVDYELGGVALNDSSQGLQVKVWRAQYLDGVVVLDAPGVSPVEVISVDNLFELSLTFDQNMQPFIAYTVAGGSEAFFYWFDATIPAFRTDALGAGSITPRCALDDKRSLQGAVSDIILAYARGGNLYYRQQRDRYEDETLLYEGVGALVQVGMSNRLRFQFLVAS